MTVKQETIEAIRAALEKRTTACPNLRKRFPGELTGHHTDETFGKCSCNGLCRVPDPLFAPLLALFREPCTNQKLRHTPEGRIYGCGVCKDTGYSTRPPDWPVFTMEGALDGAIWFALAGMPESYAYLRTLQKITKNRRRPTNQAAADALLDLLTALEEAFGANLKWRGEE